MSTKFLVISYDADEQQTFWDYVIAADQEHAKAFINRHRLDSVVVEAIRSEDLIGVAECLMKADETELIAGMRTVVSDFVEINSRAGELINSGGN